MPPKEIKLMTKAHDILLKIQLFEGLPEDHLEKIRELSIDTHCNRDEIIFFDEGEQ